MSGCIKSHDYTFEFKFLTQKITTMVKKSKGILWTAVAAGAMLGAASLFASCNTESKEVGTETHVDSTKEHKCGAETKCGASKDSSAEAKCGTSKDSVEAKCGEHKTKEAKCGEGKCGADKKK